MTGAEQQAEWRKRNPERSKQILKKSYLKYRKKRIKENNKWLRENPECMAFTDARRRCNDPKNASYSYYGARGITFKLRNYKEIVSTIGKRPSNNYSLDRINNNGHYEIGNLRWATRSQQQRNKGDKYVHQR